MSVDRALEQRVKAMGVQADVAMQARLLAYVQLLDKWNRVYNLTAVRDVADMATYHLLDSLAVLPHIAGRSLVDVGSGGGLPGIPIAIACPDRRVVVLDSSHKKAAFLRQAAIELALTNVTVVCERVEAWQPPERFDVVISRAFAELAQFVAVAGHLCADDGVMAAMKGVYPDEELTAAIPGYRVERVEHINVPGLAADRHLVLLRRNAVTAVNS